MRQRLTLACLLALAVGAVLTNVGAQSNSRLFASLVSQLTTGGSTPITCTQSGSGCYLDVSIAGGGGTFGGPVLFTPDNTYDIGAAGANRPRSIYAAANVMAGTAGSLFWNARSQFTSPSDGVIALLNNAGTDFSRLQFGGTTSAYTGLIPVRVGAVPQGFILGLADGTAQTFANLGAATNGAMVYCADCAIAAVCVGVGTGAIAKRLNSVWVCN